MQKFMFLVLATFTLMSATSFAGGASLKDLNCGVAVDQDAKDFINSQNLSFDDHLTCNEKTVSTSSLKAVAGTYQLAKGANCPLPETVQVNYSGTYRFFYPGNRTAELQLFSSVAISADDKVLVDTYNNINGPYGIIDLTAEVLRSFKFEYSHSSNQTIKMLVKECASKCRTPPYEDCHFVGHEEVYKLSFHKNEMELKVNPKSTQPTQPSFNTKGSFSQFVVPGSYTCLYKK